MKKMIKLYGTDLQHTVCPIYSKHYPCKDEVLYSQRINAITIRIPLNSNSINAIPSQIDHTVSKVNYCTTETFKKFSELSRNSNLSIFRCAVCLPLMHSRNCVTPYRPVSPPLNISTSCRGLTVSVKNTQLLIHYKS